MAAELIGSRKSLPVGTSRDVQQSEAVAMMLLSADPKPAKKRGQRSVPNLQRNMYFVCFSKDAGPPTLENYAPKGACPFHMEGVGSKPDE